MYQIQIDHPVHAHFIGIGGTSMSGLAEFLLMNGFTVTGSDSAHSKYTGHLESLGVKISYPQSADNITDDIDVVIFSAAIRPGNPEYDAADYRGIPMLTRAELLGQLMAMYDNAINIAGTHGKTTTTSMVTQILLNAGMDPSVEIGGVLPAIGGNMRIGENRDLMVVEACEYTNSFLSFHPTIGVILNVEADHLDFFKDINDIRRSFRAFANLLPEDGVLVLNSEITDRNYFTDNLKAQVMTFGRDPKADFTARNISLDLLVRPTFTVVEHGKEMAEITLNCSGEHNVWNALAAIAVARYLGVSYEAIQKALRNFRGASRRFDIFGTVNGFTVMDDYAHHPQEVDVVIKTLLKYPHHKLWAVQQPHTYSRTKMLMQDFADVLSQSEAVLVLDIFPARETDTLGVTAEQLVDELKKRGTEVYYTPTFDDAEKFIMEHCEKDDIVVTLGCGNANILADRLVTKYGKPAHEE